MLRFSMINFKINSLKRSFEIITMLIALILSDVTYLSTTHACTHKFLSDM